MNRSPCGTKISNLRNLEPLKLNLSLDVENAYQELVELQREFHRHPELGFQEHRTQQKILDCLHEWGIEAHTIAETGVVGLISGPRPAKTLLLRADMDALAIEEENDFTWRSKEPGKMHACGHDAHMAMLLTTARLLKERGLESGTVKLMFQPAEEGSGGALRMIDDGILEDPAVDASLAFHVWSQFPVGEVVAISGPVAASVDGFKIVVEGKGAHAATPEAGVDPVFIAAQIVTSAQALITRCTSARDTVVLSFTSINAGTAFNIIPGSAEILGTFRTFNAELRSDLKQRLSKLVELVAQSFGGKARYETIAEDVPVVNEPTMTRLFREAAREVVGEPRLIAPPPLLVGEDIGEVQKLVPGAMVLLGCGDPSARENAPHHNPCFCIDERVLPIGVEIYLRAVRAYFAKN
jgi:amidohydrolase